jgi:hypothetical protein
MRRFWCGHKFQFVWINIKEHKLPQKLLYYFVFWPATNEGFCCSSSLPALIWHCSGCGHFNRCAVVSRYFSLQFLNVTWCEASFHMLICYLFVLFSEVSIQHLCFKNITFTPFFNLMYNNLEIDFLPRFNYFYLEMRLKNQAI